MIPRRYPPGQVYLPSGRQLGLRDSQAAHGHGEHALNQIEDPQTQDPEHYRPLDVSPRIGTPQITRQAPQSHCTLPAAEKRRIAQLAAPQLSATLSLLPTCRRKVRRRLPRHEVRFLPAPREDAQLPATEYERVETFVVPDQETPNEVHRMLPGLGLPCFDGQDR